jgi:hypothetical protein
MIKPGKPAPRSSMTGNELTTKATHPKVYTTKLISKVLYWPRLLSANGAMKTGLVK